MLDEKYRPLLVMIVRILVGANVLAICVYGYLRFGGTRANSAESISVALDQVPQLRVEDVKGNRFELLDRGRPTVIHFLDERVASQCESALRIGRAVAPIGVRYLAVSDRGLRNCSNHEPSPATATEIVYPAAYLRSLFRPSTGVDSWYTFDHSGRIRDKGISSPEIAIAAAKRLRNGTGSFSVLVVQDALQEALRRNQLFPPDFDATGLVLGMLLSKANSGCAEMDVLRKLNAQASSGKRVVLFVSAELAPSIEVMKSNLELRFPVYSAYGDFESKWHSLIETFGEQSMNGLVFRVSSMSITEVANSLPAIDELLK